MNWKERKSMNHMTRAILYGRITAAFVCLLVIGPRVVRAQVVSNPGNVSLNAVVDDSLGIYVSASNVNFNLIPGTGPTAGTPTVTVTTTWTLHPGGTPTLSLYGFFASSTAALSNGAGIDIPSANVLAGINGGAPTAFTQTGPLGGANASLQIFSIPISGVNKNSSRNDTLDLYIDLTSQPSLPAGVYTGVLSLQARAL